MDKNNLMFGDIEIKKKIYRYKSPIFKKDVDIEKVLVCNKISCGPKKFINILLVPYIMIMKLSHYI